MQIQIKHNEGNFTSKSETSKLACNETISFIINNFITYFAYNLYFFSFTQTHTRFHKP